MQDNTYYEYLSEEVAVQRNNATDELAKARTELRLANIQIASLETELFHAKQDAAKHADENDSLYEYAETMRGYLEYLENKADAAMAESLKRLRERIDVLEAENARLEALVDWNGVDSASGWEDRGEVFLVEEPYWNQSPTPPNPETTQAPPLAPAPYVEPPGAPGQSSEVQNTVFGGNWVEVKDEEKPSIIIPAQEEVQQFGIAGAPGQGSQVLGTVFGGQGKVPDSVLDAVAEQNSGDELPITSTPVDGLQEIVLEETGDTNVDRKIRELIAKHTNGGEEA